MRLLLVRHGRTTSNVAQVLDTAPPGADLDDIGRAQALALVDRLRPEPIDAIYVSDLARTQQTAAPLAAARSLVPIVTERVREIQAGDLEMSPDWAPYVQTILRWRTDPEHRMPGGETGTEVLSRFDAAIALAHEAAYHSVVVVSHGAMIRTWTVSRVLGLPPEFVAKAPMDNTVVIDLDGEPGGPWRLRRWGDHTFA